MKITRRFAVATLLVLAVAVVLGTPAPATVFQRTLAAYKLYPTADSPFPHATGKVTLYFNPASTPPLFIADGVIVSVSKLAPNASYYMPVTLSYYDNYWGWLDEVYNVPIQTDAHGTGKGGFGYSDYIIMSFLFQVYDSSGTLVLTSNP